MTYTIDEGAQRIRLRDAVGVLLSFRAKGNAEIKLVKVYFQSNNSVIVLGEKSRSSVLMANPPNKLSTLARETFLQLPLPLRKLKGRFANVHDFAVVVVEDKSLVQFLKLDRSKSEASRQQEL